MSDSDDLYNFNRGRMFEQVNAKAVPAPAPVRVNVPDYGAALAIAEVLKQTRIERNEWRNRAKQLECYAAAHHAMIVIMEAEIDNCQHEHPSKNKEIVIQAYERAYIEKTKENNLPLKEWDDFIVSRMKIYDFPIITTSGGLPQLDAQEAKNSWYVNSWVDCERNIQANCSAVSAVNTLLISKINEKLTELGESKRYHNKALDAIYFFSFLIKAKEIGYTPKDWPPDIKQYAKDNNVALKDYLDIDDCDVTFDSRVRKTISSQTLQQISSWVTATRMYECISAGNEKKQIAIMGDIKKLKINFARKELEAVFDKEYIRVANYINFPRANWPHSILRRNP
jgi:hypothetical protein